MLDADVLVVGGGPVGFVVALGLARAGLAVELVEAAERIGDAPRAAVYHWSVLDGLERLGLLDDARAAGIVKRDYCYLVRATGERIRFDLSVLEGHTPHPYNIHLGQHRLTGIAHRHLSAMPGARIRFGARVERIEQDGDGVTAYLAGAGEPVRARWLVGADGGASSVRRLLGLPFEGYTWPERFVATNLRFDFEAAGHARTTMVIDDRHGAVIVKLAESGLWRCTFMEDAALPEQGLAGRIPAAFREILPHDGPWELAGASPYRMHQRAAPRFRVGRVLLAGDAAHVTNPTGGLGLTSGLFDADALHPALAAVARSEAGDERLDWYAGARRRVFLERVSPQAERNKRLIFHANGGGRALGEALDDLRRVAADPVARLERLLFSRSLATPPPML